MKKLKANALSRIQLKKVLGEVTGSDSTCSAQQSSCGNTPCNASSEAGTCKIINSSGLCGCYQN